MQQHNTFSGPLHSCQQQENELQQCLDQCSQEPEETVSKKVFEERVLQLVQQQDSVIKKLDSVKKELENAQTGMMEGRITRIPR